MKVIFDTGSNVNWLFSQKCKQGECPNKNVKYAQEKSIDFRSNEEQGQLLKYGRGEIAGIPASDRMCFSKGNQNCVGNMNFLSVFKAKEVEALKGSGLVGLSPSPAKEAELKDPFHNDAPGFIA